MGGIVVGSQRWLMGHVPVAQFVADNDISLQSWPLNMSLGLLEMSVWTWQHRRDTVRGPVNLGVAAFGMISRKLPGKVVDAAIVDPACGQLNHLQKDCDLIQDLWWRRMGDSNPRGLSPNTLSKRASQTTRRIMRQR